MSQARTEDVNRTDSNLEISRFSSALLMLFHDAMKLGSLRNRFESNLIPRDDGTLNTVFSADETFDDLMLKKTKSEIWCRWAGTRYKGSYRNFADLYWPPPNVLSVWGLDVFRRFWNDTIERSKEAKEKDQVEILAYGWVTGGCAVIDERQLDLFVGKQVTTAEGEKYQSFVPDFEDWRTLFVRLNRIADHYLTKQHREQTESTHRTRRWLQNVVVMFMPESGLPTRLMFQALFGLSVEAHPDEGLDEATTSDEQTMFQSRNAQELKKTSEKLTIAALDFVKFANSKNGKMVRDCWKKAQVDDSHVFSVVEKLLEDPVLLSAIKEEIEKTFPVPGNGKRKMDATFAAWVKLLRSCEKTDEKSRNNYVTFNRLFNAWISRFSLMRFIEEHKTEVRARRGVRLSILSRIVEGALTKRLRRSQLVHLACFNSNHDIKTNNWEMLTDEYGSVVSNLVTENTYMTLGSIFSGGGLVPHENEVPGLPIK